MAGTTRREVLLAGAALGLIAGIATPTSVSADDAHLLALGAELDRLRRRVRRLRAKVRPAGDPTAWSRWSRAVTDCAELCERIAREPAESLAGLAVRYRALIWELTEDDVVLDRAVRRQVLAFGRELDALAKGQG